MKQVVVIGAGAAGMAAAIAASDAGDRVVLLERMDRVGKKLLATGNGRCNLMNTSAPRYPGGEAFAQQVLSAFGAARQMAFWHALGLGLREEDEGRVYPASGQASTVLDTLRLALDARHVRILTGTRVEAIARDDEGWAARTDAGAVRGERIIVSGGGMAQSKLGSDGSCYGLLRSAGHTLITPKPALTQIVTEAEKIRGLSGIRAKACLTVQRGSQTLCAQQGEALFTDYGVSGVCAMQCARYAEKGATLHLNLLPGMGLADAREAAEALHVRRKSWAEQPMERLLTGLCVPRLSSCLCADAGVRWKDRLIGSLTEREISALSGVMADFALRVQGVKGFDQAQVTSGGICREEFDPATMESRLAPGLYAAGEVLDVDGDCGGFNLMFAFASGVLAGLAGRKYPDGEEHE